MRFLINHYYTDEQPCAGAFLAHYTYTDYRTVDDPQKLRTASSLWYSEGTNHRIENGCIARDFTDRIGWCIDIESLEQLADLCEVFAPIRIKKVNTNYLEIELSDDNGD